MNSRLAAPRPDIIAVSLVMHLLALALPMALLQIYDRILPAQAIGTATVLIAGVAVAIVLEAFLRYGRTALFAHAGARFEAEATARALERLAVADVAAVEKRGAAAVADALRAIGQVRDFWSGQAGVALYEAPFVLVYLALIAYIGGWLSWIPAALFALAALVALFFNSPVERAATAAEQADARRRDLMWTTFAGIDDVKAMGAENAVSQAYRRLNANYMGASAHLETRMAWIRENAGFFGQLATILVVAFGALEVMDGQLTTGALAACSILAGRSIGPAMGSLGYWSQLARIREAERRVAGLFDLPPVKALDTRVAADGAARGPAVERGALRIDAPGLLPAPVNIAPGEVVHVDGPDDAEVSRLLTCIAGLASDPVVRVTVNGHPQAEFAHRDYRAAVCLVSRQPALVPGSILANLTLFDSRYNEAALELCARLGLQPYLDRLRHGVLSEVGPGAAEHLDEGIYQRIFLIRALVRRPRILLLDHAAMGIDLDGVKRLATQLQSLAGNTTVLVASHKPALVEACTRRLTLAGGRA